MPHMKIVYNVTETEIRHTSPPYLVPTVEVRVETPRDATPSELVKLHAAARCDLMAAAHAIAAKLWSANVNGLDVTIEPPYNGVVRVIMDAGRDEAARGEVLRRMRAIVTPPKAQAPKSSEEQPTTPAH